MPRLVLWLYLVAPLGSFAAPAEAPAADGVTWAALPSDYLGGWWQEEVEKLRATRVEKPAKGCLSSESVAWGRQFDPLGFELADGRQLGLEVSDEALSQIDTWVKGKLLTLCYDEARGVTLVDRATGNRFRVRSISGKHPIDSYLASLNPQTTPAMNAVTIEAQRLWRLEIDRSVREVLALPHLPAKVRAEFVALTKVRLDYCGRQSGFGAEAIARNYEGGTIIGPLSGEYAASLYRTAYLDLARLYEDYRSFGSATEAEKEGMGERQSKK